MREATKPAKLYARLQVVHGRSQLLNMLMGLMTLSSWLILLFLLALAVDWVIHLHAALRGIVLPALLAYPVYRAWAGGWRNLKAFSGAENALKVEKHYENMESLLVTGVQLSEQTEMIGTSEAMSDLTVKKADAASGSFDPAEVVPFGIMKRPLVRSVFLSLVILAIALMNMPLLKTGLTRVFTPWRSAHYPTRTGIELAGAGIVVKEGDAVVISARISGEMPTQAKLALKTGKGRPHSRNLDIAEGVCEYKIASAFRSFDYCISAGDAETDWQRVRVISAPRPATTRIRLVYPEYMGRKPEVMESMTLTVPEGVRVEWALTLDSAVSSAAFIADDSQPVQLKVSDNGFVVTHAMDAKASGTYAFSWVEKEHNFSFATAKHYLQVAPDQAPQVELTRPKDDLFATIGRELHLAYRVRDDHGIGAARVVYRRGMAEEKSVPFVAKISDGRATQVVDWDYRKAIKNIEIGEDITFALEVSDKYPPPGGPHLARSEFRRISFLSKEDYLAKVREQKGRLLDQLRAVYRQERAAYDVIRALDPRDASFEQTCFLESARQDILMERIALLGEGIVEIIDDLKANNIDEKSEFEGLNELRARLGDVSTKHIGAAAAKLRDLGPNVRRDRQDVLDAANTINAAARAMSSLVLQLGVREAMEVFASELHVIAQEQSALRAETLELAGKDAALSARQRELASWIDALLTELAGRRDYTKDPLMIVRLVRMVKHLRSAGIEKCMTEGSALLAGGKISEAVDLQSTIIRNIFELECGVRVGSEYEALLNGEEIFSKAITQLGQLGLPNSGMTAAENAHALRTLRRAVRLLILPSIPATGEELLDKKPNEIPPADALVSAAQDALEAAAKAVETGKQDLFKSKIDEAAGVFGKLDGITGVRIREISKVARYAGQSGMSVEWAGMIRELFTGQLRLSEKAEDANYKKTSGAYLAPSQLQLSADVLKMRDRLQRKSRGTGYSRMVPPMLALLERASSAMAKAAPALKEDKLPAAKVHQDDALDALQTATGFADHEAAGWLALANLIMSAEGIALPAKYVRDIVAEQRDLIAATKASMPESRKELLAIQKNLSAALLEIRSILADPVAALDFEQTILSAASDMDSSVRQIESGSLPAAMKAQEIAVASVFALSRQLDRSKNQYYYFVIALEFLQDRHTDGVVLLDEFSRVISSIKASDGKKNQGSSGALSSLAEGIGKFCAALDEATAMPVYGKALGPVKNALAKYEAGQSKECLDELTVTESSLKESMAELRGLASKIAFIPSVKPDEAPREYYTMMEMVDLLLRQKAVSVAAYRADAKDLPKLVPEVRGIVAAASNLLVTTKQHASIVAAGSLTEAAIAPLDKGDGKNAYAKLDASEDKLRQCILEYALRCVEIPEPGRVRHRKKVKPPVIVTMFKMSNKLIPEYDKNWGGVGGEDPKGGRSEWEVLGRRDRAALNENFVRELPLEYREFLKDYYERLAK